MMPRYFLTLLLGFMLVACCLGKSFSSPLEDEVTNIYKSYLREKNACATYDDYERVNQKYASLGKLARMKLPKMRNTPDALKASIFSVIQATSFGVSELEVKKIDIRDGAATVLYARTGHPELTGEASLVKEDGSWKIDSDTLKTK
ncbi:MAG: hypothetical protein NT033_08995 [Candidatus Omnitrophica bacterium]|nr:hypothetical protein [Candidatus Omnitrophota bacterium]